MMVDVELEREAILASICKMQGYYNFALPTCDGGWEQYRIKQMRLECLIAEAAQPEDVSNLRSFFDFPTYSLSGRQPGQRNTFFFIPFYF